MHLQVSGVMSEFGSTSVTPLAIYSALVLLLLCRSSVLALLFLRCLCCNSFRSSLKNNNPLRLWNPPFVRYFDVNSALRRIIIMTVVALWWYELWEKCEVVNWERVVRNAYSISPLLVFIVSLYSFASDTGCMLTTYDVSDVFDAEHTTIGLIKVEHNINTHNPPLYVELRRTSTTIKVSLILRFFRGDSQNSKNRILPVTQ